MVNIVMTARNRHNLTEQALASLILNTPPNKYTLTLVDDGSDPSLETTVIHPGGHCSILRVTNSGHVLSKLKNLGVEYSRQRFGEGDWLYLSDNDVFFKPGWLDILEQAYMMSKEYRYLLIGGQNHPFHQGVGEFTIAPRYKMIEYDSLAGTSWFMKWSTWEKYGPLNENTAAGVCQSEDHEFCQEIRAEGGKVGAVFPNVVLDTGITQTDGNKSPGWDVKKRESGVIYE